MPNYRLHYFKTAGRAEVARLVFHAAGQEYEEVYYGEGTDRKWDNDAKKVMPLGQMPVLEVDGQLFCQSGSIARYLASKFGFMGKNAEEAIFVDMVHETLYNDLGSKLVGLYYEKDEEKKKEIREKLTKEFDDVLTKMSGWVKGDFFLGDQMSLADIAMAASSQVKNLLPDISMPSNLLKIVEKVEAQEGIAKYRQSQSSP